MTAVNRNAPAQRVLLPVPVAEKLPGARRWLWRCRSLECELLCGVSAEAVGEGKRTTIAPVSAVCGFDFADLSEDVIHHHPIQIRPSTKRIKP